MTRTLLFLFFLQVVNADYGVTQRIIAPYNDRILKVMKRTKRYMEQNYATQTTNCENQHELCSYWASLGECNDILKKDLCRPACQACLLQGRCQVFENNNNNSTTTRYTFPERASSIHTTTILSKDPLVFQIDNFLSPNECQAVIDWAETGNRFEPSRETHNRSLARTSETAWCFTPDCLLVTYNITQRLETLLQIPSTNFEHHQILRYRKGQYYRRHHDAQVAKYAGRRLVTAYIYLNEPDLGGETEFPVLNLTVAPQQGKLVVWSNYRNDHSLDERTDHEAKAVMEGVKYGMNIWAHESDFKGPWELKCL